MGHRSFSTVTNCIEFVWRTPDTPPFASYSVHTQTEVEATLAIGFSGKGSIVSLVWLDILDRRPSRKRCCFQCASINLLERENVHRIARKESPCFDVIAIQFAKMSNQILQDQENVLLKMYDNLQSAWKHK